ncbi:unnamed protein product [Moneuplotes crassus]|uniref:FAD/NAD(P)-binding domain-containing protein n=1 Tax=Euplotes crassus TaxID=5936 RepID=A0AAD1XDZ7_EUPCR|nr:unnamed protein product [Moneuplotes crassus]
MGNTQPQKKRLVIVGGSFAGLLLLDKVKDDFEVVLIEKKDHFEWICSLPHSIVNPEYFNKDATVDLHQCLTVDRVFGPNVRYLQGMVTEITDQTALKYKPTKGLDSAKELENVQEEILEFDLLVICTGAVYKINEGSAEDVANIFSKYERSKLIQKYHEEIDEAAQVLVVGGGPTGVEALGEIVDKYGTSKEYGLLNSQDRLLTGFPTGVSRRAYNYFNAKRTFKECYLGKYYSPEDEIAQKYDYTLMCAGMEYYTPFMTKNFENCVDQRGRIFVNQYFQVTSQDPTKSASADHQTYDNIFCYGDACFSPMQEIKNVPSIRETSYTVKKNLKAVSYGGKLSKMTYAIDNLSAVYYNKWRGSIVLNNLGLPNCLTLKSKKFIEETYMGKFRNKCCSKCRFKLYNCQVNFLSCFVNNCCCCCSCSKRKRFKQRRAIVRALIEHHRQEEGSNVSESHVRGL